MGRLGHSGERKSFSHRVRKVFVEERTIKRLWKKCGWMLAGGQEKQAEQDKARDRSSDALTRSLPRWTNSEIDRSRRTPQVTLLPKPSLASSTSTKRVRNSGKFRFL